MHKINRNRRQKGTVLIIALAVLFTLSILGLIFVRIVAGATIQAVVGSQRILANELAQAGIRYSFAQLRFSEDGADWRPQPAAGIDPPLAGRPGLGPSSDPDTGTNPDPDYFWMRRQVNPGPVVAGDSGGPDGLGPYTRINYRGGRALIRVRYAPSGGELFTGNAVLPIGDFGKLRAYTIIESVGRPGEFNPLDPTSTRKPNLQNARQLSAIASIGMLEAARSVSNKDGRTEPIDFGIPADFGSNYLGTPVNVPMVVGGEVVPVPPGSYPAASITLGGPMYFNGDLRIHGSVLASLNADLGDQININGDLSFANGASGLAISRITAVGGVVTTANVNALPSTNPNFTTGQGVLRDIRELPDQAGYPRSVPRKEFPLVDEQDPNTGQLRYRNVTRDSGVVVNVGGNFFNLGRLGYGRGIWVNNTSDFARDSEDGDFTLRYDWMNPNNGNPNSGWQGPYYVPPAAYILMQHGGFTIGRNARNNRDTWRNYQGADTGRHTLRFKVGLGTDGRRRIINELTPGVANFGSPTPADFSQGPEFNGVIMAEGNVRVRGVIPDGLQITLITLGTAYVEGSVVKGTDDSTLAILARDNVAINSTQFLSPSFENTLQIVRDNNDPTSPARIKVDPSNPLNLYAQFPINPITGNSYLQDYSFPNAGQTTVPALYLAHAAEFDRSSFVNFLINGGLATPTFLFSALPPNAAQVFYGAVDPIPTYGLGNPATQVLPVYEKRSFLLWPISGLGVGGNGTFSLLLDGSENEIQLKKDGTIAPPTGNADYFVSRAAVQPMDVRIEAVMFAQEGSFFVIPGAWFNWNPNDRRDAFTTAANRFATFGATEDFPFYGEPLDIRVNIVGSVTENFPASVAEQSSWLQKWGWIPATYGGSGIQIPVEHNPFNSLNYAPNLFISYDPVLMSGRANGTFDGTAVPPIRTDIYGRALPPMPKLPVGTKLFYFGEVNP